MIIINLVSSIWLSNFVMGPTPYRIQPSLSLSHSIYYTRNMCVQMSCQNTSTISHITSLVGWARITVFKTPVFRVPWHRGWSKQAQHVSLHADDWQSRFSVGMYMNMNMYSLPMQAGNIFGILKSKRGGIGASRNQLDNVLVKKENCVSKEKRNFGRSKQTSKCLNFVLYQLQNTQEAEVLMNLSSLPSNFMLILL